MWNARLDEAQAGIKTEGRNINNLRYADDTIFMAESEEELKSPLMKVKEKRKKAGLKLNIQKIKIMAHPVSSLHGKQMGKQWKQWQTFIFLGSKITTVTTAMQLKDARSLEEKLSKTWKKKCMVWKSRDITLLTQECIVKAMVFPLVTYEYESWTINKAESQRIDAFNLWCLRRLLRVPQTARKSTLNIHWKDWCWSSNPLATWWEKLTHWKIPWCWERQKAEGDNRRRDGWMASLTQWTWVWASSGRWWRTWKPVVLQSIGSKNDQGTEQQLVRMKQVGQSRSAVYVSGGQSKVWSCKEQYYIGIWNVMSMNQGKLDVVREMTRLNIDILRISELKWTGMGEFNSYDHCIYYCGRESLRRHRAVNKRVWNAVLGWKLKNNRMISVCFQGKPFNITVIQVYTLTTDAEEAEADQFYEDLQHLLEPIPKKGLMIGDWSAN